MKNFEELFSNTKKYDALVPVESIKPTGINIRMYSENDEEDNNKSKRRIKVLL